MGIIIPGPRSRCNALAAGSGPNQGAFLDGRTASLPPLAVPSVGLATGNVEPFTGARWLALPVPNAPANQVFLQSLSDIEGPQIPRRQD